MLCIFFILSLSNTIFYFEKICLRKPEYDNFVEKGSIFSKNYYVYS